ncbi:unnamed protein product [Rangifer tarandus platyrhynchus]|uniref:Uncharacterized protein n=2 Tax=Rangifer tarandus platyrhynchus TaxID=3082113 RepID=A0ACB0EZ53_RANTA|nr:unnamed protein product [Rangifer tarandus platyrhynchus]CAI9706082.1 unnamed protein product [Rangifer tarandus platyrhynchus]
MWWTRNAWDRFASFAAFGALCTPASGTGLRRPRRQGAERAVLLSALRRCGRNLGEPAAAVAGPPPRPVPGPTLSLKGDFSSAVAAEGDEGPVRP